MEILQGVWKQHLRPRAVVGYGIKIFFPSPQNYVTRSPGSVVAYRFKSLFEKISKPFSIVTSKMALSPQIFPDRILHILNQLSHAGAVRLYPVTSAFSL